MGEVKIISQVTDNLPKVNLLKAYTKYLQTRRIRIFTSVSNPNYEFPALPTNASACTRIDPLSYLWTS